MAYDPAQIERILNEEALGPPFPAASDRAIWHSGLLADEDAAAILRAAESAAQSPPPALPATLYLEVKRNGQREGYEAAAFERERRLCHLALAECLEYQGRFRDAILDYAWAICEESSWVMPAHQYELAEMD